jgi:DNA invertase Pin-like site-specific DNA recombinase
MQTAVYIRVSTTSQNQASQRREINRWLRGNGIEDVAVYVDQSTGDNLRRPEFERLQKAIFNGEVKTVVVYKLDRLSRSLADGITTLTDWLSKGVRVVSITQQLDFSGATGKLIASVLFAVAEMEQETRRERQAAGIAAAKEQGVYLGGKAGRTKNGKKPARAVELRDRGLTYGEIAEAMSVSQSTVRRYLGVVPR